MVDAIDWAADRLDVYDPVGLVGVYGVYFFYITPLLHVVLDSWPPYVPPVSDWRDSLGTMAILNLLGLAVYRVLVAGAAQSRPHQSVKLISLGRLQRAAWIGVIISSAATLGLVLLLGGPVGYLNSLVSDRANLSGLGWLLMVSESLPLMLFVVVIARYREGLRRRPGALWLMMAGFAIVIFLVSGLRGSRGGTIWPLLVLLGIIHLVVRPVLRRSLAVVALLTVAFMFAYGIYKSAGIEMFGEIQSGESISDLSTTTGRGLPQLLLGDFGRAGIQAILVDRLMNDDVTLAYGTTYVGDVLVLVPQSILPSRPPGKSQIGTDALYGGGAFASGFDSQNIYGIAGEAMLNFGMAAAPLSFVLFGIYVRFARGYYRSAESSRSLGRCFVAPGLSVLAVVVLFNDLDNTLYFFLKAVLPVAAVVWAASRRQGRSVPGARLPSRARGRVSVLGAVPSLNQGFAGSVKRPRRIAFDACDRLRRRPTVTTG